MSERAYTGLTVEVRRTVEGSLYEIGVVVEGVFLSFAARSAPDIDSRIAEAAEAQREADAAAAAERAKATEAQRQAALEESQRQADEAAKTDEAQRQAALDAAQRQADAPPPPPPAT